MAIEFKDFAPAVLNSGLLSKSFETLDLTVGRANEWIASHHVRVINVETVVLMGINSEADTTKVYWYNSQVVHYMSQVVRVWYETRD